MDTYDLHGVRLQSEIPFPGLPATDAVADAFIRLGSLASEASTAPGSWSLISADSALIRWSDFATVRVTSGREIVVDPVPGAEPSWLQTVLLGQIFSVLLLQRGLFPLHASAVVLDGKAVAIAAAAGGGKSTLAAALHARGAAFLADDVVALQLDAEPPIAFPGIPVLKLEPQSLARLGRSAADFPRVVPDEEKRAVAVLERVCAAPVPLAGIYVLGDGQDGAIERVPPQLAFREIMQNCHHVENQLPALGPAGLMARCARVAELLPVYRLHRSGSLEHLEELARRIEEHARP